MNIKRIHIGGNREEINRETGEHTPNFIDSVKRSDLIITPERLLEKIFNGNNQDYTSWLMKHNLHPSQINYNKINQKQELIRILKEYMIRLLEEAKSDSMFSNILGNLIITKWIDSFDTLENHIYDLSNFDKIEFIKISEEFKKRFDTYSPFAFLTIDDINQQLKVVESHKVLLLLEKSLPMGNKRGTPAGQEPEKLYQNFFTTIGYKGKGELTEGLNYHRTNFKNFNFNINIETRVLIDIIYKRLEYSREEIQIAFLFGAYGKKLYFESDIKGTDRTQEELEAIAITEDARAVIEKELHKERQGSISVDKTTIEVKNRITPPKVTKENIELKEEKEQSTNNSLSNRVEAFEKEMFIRQQGYAELAKVKIDEAINNRTKYIQEFHTFLKKGMSVTDALNKFSQRYANNPYIKGIIETSITGELQLQYLKDKGIEELNHTINRLENQKESLYQELDNKETQIASLNQNIDSIMVQHTKQLQEIEVNISKLVEERASLIYKNNKQLELIVELEQLIAQYEHTLREKESQIKEMRSSIESVERSRAEYDRVKSSLIESNKKIESLENKNITLSRELERSNSEIKYYSRQIEQLKEENRLTLSATNLLKTINTQLESKNSELLREIESLKKDK